MRLRILALVILCLAGCYGVAHLRSATKAKVPFDSRTGETLSAATPISQVQPRTRIDFATQIKPLLEPKCQPCHFSGGKVYASMPFDRAETIKTLGTKLFTRIKDENQRQLIREFLAQD